MQGNLLGEKDIIMTAYVNQIIAWDQPTPPENWLICDGTGGTPDLRGLFIYGKYDDSDTPITGGSSIHTHVSGEVSTTADHGHSISVSLASVTATVTRGTSTYNALTTHAHNTTINTSGDAGGHSHTVSLDSSNGLPPCILLYFIMKVV